MLRCQCSIERPLWGDESALLNFRWGQMLRSSPQRPAVQYAFDRMTADVAAKLFQRLALVGSAAYGGVRASLDIIPPSPCPPIE